MAPCRLLLYGFQNGAGGYGVAKAREETCAFWSYLGFLYFPLTVALGPINPYLISAVWFEPAMTGMPRYMVWEE